MKVTLVQYVYIVSVSFYHMHRFVQPPSQPRDRTSCYRDEEPLSSHTLLFLSTFGKQLFSISLFIFIILRMLHKWNPSVWDLLWDQFFFIWDNALESHSCCCIHAYMGAKSLQSCPTLWNPMDRIPAGASVHGILQARILEWVAMPSFRGSSWPRDQNCLFCLLHWLVGSLPLAPPGKWVVVFIVGSFLLASSIPVVWVYLLVYFYIFSSHLLYLFRT